jgi:hypothetical protein
MFIFGAFEGDLPGSIVMLGLQKMIENSLDTYETAARKTPPEVIEPPKSRPAPQFAPLARS